VRLIDVFGRWCDTVVECDAFCKELKQNLIDGLCESMGYMEYILRLLRAVNTIHHCHFYPLPSVETVKIHKWGRQELASSDAAVLYHLQRRCSGIGFN